MRPINNVNKKKNVIFILYVLALLVLNMTRITGNDFWLDETYSIHGITMNGTRTLLMYLATGEIDLYPPLYYIISRAVCSVVGFNGYVYQFVSLIPLFVVGIVSVTIIKREFGIMVAAAVFTFWAMIRNALIVNIEVRAYSFAAFFIFMAYLEMYFVLKYNRGRDYFWLTIFSMCGAYTHYFCVVGIGFFYLGIIAYNLLQSRKLKMVLESIMVCIVLYVPWGIALLKGYFSTNKVDGYWLEKTESMIVTFGYAFSGMIYLPLIIIGFIGVMLVIFKELDFFDSITAKLNIFEIDADSSYEKKTEGFTSKREDPIITWIIWGCIAFIGTGLLGTLISILTTPFFVAKYIYPVSTVIWFVASVLPMMFKNKRVIGGSVVVYVLLVGIIYCFAGYKEANVINFRENATREAISGISDDEVVVVYNGVLTETQVEYYIPDRNVVYIKQNEMQNVHNESKECGIIIDTSDFQQLKITLDELGAKYEMIYDNGYLGVGEMYVGRIVYE